MTVLRDRVLAAEVWLGPLEGLRAVAPPASPQSIRIGRVDRDPATHEPNQLVLSGIREVSSSHAVLRVSGERLFVRDLGSANGTFTAEQKVRSDRETEIGPDDVILLSSTPVVVRFVGPGERPVGARQVAPGSWDGPAAKRVLKESFLAALGRGEKYIDTRHLLDGLLRIPDGDVDEALRNLGSDRALALQKVWTGDLFPSHSDFLARIHARALAAPAAEAVSPRVATILDFATEATGGSPRRQGRFLRAVLQGLLEQGGPVETWLKRSRQAGPPEAPARRSREVFELAGRLAETIGKKQLKTAAERRRTLTDRVSRRLAEVSEESRSVLSEAAELLMPLLAEDSADSKAAGLQLRIEELEHGLAEAQSALARARKTAAPANATPLPVRQIVEGVDLAEDENAIAVLHHVTRFAVNMEGLILGLVQAHLVAGSDSSFRLSGFDLTVREILSSLASDAPVSRDGCRRYLEELERWQIAFLAAYHEAPASWFERLWKRTSPSAILAAESRAGRKARPAEAWEQYTQAVKDLSPEVASDQVLHLVATLARETHRKMPPRTEQAAKRRGVAARRP